MLRALGRLRIRTRIAVGSLVVAVLLAVPAGLVLDAQLRHIVRLGTSAVLKSDSEPYLAEIAQGAQADYDKPGPNELVSVVRPDGSTALDTLPAALRDQLPALLVDEDTRDVKAGGRSYLVRSTPATGTGGEWHVIAVRARSSEDASVGPMRILLAVVLVALVLGVAVGAWLLAAISLRPVSRLRRSAELIAQSGSDETLPLGRTDDEIRALAVTLNDLVSRLRGAAERERRLVSDASHELRTPVAVLRTRLELARTGSGDADALRADIAEAERGAVRLGSLLESLLELSAIQAGGHAAASPLSEVADELRDAIGRAGFRSGATELRLEVDPGADRADRAIALSVADVGRLVDNLLSNSLAALGERAGHILVSLASDGIAAELRVSDDAGGLPEGIRATATQRFTRGPGARPGTGAGLGLPIVAAIVDASGGELRLDDRPGEGLTVAARIPLVRARDAGHQDPGLERADQEHPGHRPSAPPQGDRH